MNFSVRSDLACEAFGTQHTHVDGVRWRVEHMGDITVRRLEIIEESAAERLGKPCGVYLTLECGKIMFFDRETLDRLISLLAQKIGEMAEGLCRKNIGSDFCVLVAGLGNASLTADAIGPQTVQKLTATRHLRDHEEVLYREMGCASLAAIAPGVLGQTGIETQEILRGAVDIVHPDLVLAVDALAARSCDRLSSTIQISDVGICPGSGVGNARAALNAETLGVPVIAMGIPTVVDSATLVYDALSLAGMNEVDPALDRVLKNGKSFFVSPKESDLITEKFSLVLAKAIDCAFVGDL
jgi:spore protease